MYPATGAPYLPENWGEHSEEGEDQATDEESSIHSHGQQRLKVLSVDFLET